MGPAKKATRIVRLPILVSNAERRVKDGISYDPLSDDSFIEFLNNFRNGSVAKVPSKKRQKTALHLEECEHVLVRRSKIFVRLPNAQLQKLDGTIQLQNVPISIKITETSLTVYNLKLLDAQHKSGRLLLDILVPKEDVPLQDVQIASLVALEAMSSQNPPGQGRLWTEIDLRAGHDGTSSYMEILMTIKWNLTTTINRLPLRTATRPALQAVLAAYFCLPACDSVQKVDSWSPQNFYNSVHVPDREDAIAASIEPKEVSTDLYPFQKRSVRWLLEREGFQWPNVNENPLGPKIDSPLQHLPYSFYQVTDGSGQICYLSRLFNIVTKDVDPYRQVENLRGGILAEEMGLGKTVEIIALISLHQRPLQSPELVLDPYTLNEVRSCPTTLIITPPSILLQWINEISRHSPGLKVMHYGGVKAHKHLDAARLIDRLTSNDVVLTTYNVLSSEIHYTLPAPDRQLRGDKKYERPKSPLMQVSWWRVCLDEAQMVESGVSNAATVARLIPRVNAWGVTGTPVQKDVTDLLGLLVFLRLEPFVSRPHLWSSMLSDSQQSFQSIFKQLALRHTKQFVRDELRLPLQQRYVITIPFTPIEEHHYQSLFQQMCEDCGLDRQGNPLRDDWDPEEHRLIERMRTWLIRLRQTALHPDIGGRNRRALGHKRGPLRTVDDVVTAMLDQSEISIRSDQRALLLSKLKRGQTYENGPEVKRALEIWAEVLDEANSLVTECRQQLQNEILISRADCKVAGSSTDTSDVSDTDNQVNKDKESSEASSRIGTFGNKLRAALEIQHIAAFFQGNGYFQLKSNKELTEPDSEHFNDLAKLEMEGYERAKQIRQEILKEIFRKANRLMMRLSKQAASQDFVQIPEFPSSLPQGGIESRRIMEQLNDLGETLNAQANHLHEWRERAIQILIRPLVDEDEGLEVTGDEYEESTKTQEEVLVYVRALRAVIEDRHDALTGQENKLVDSEAKTALKFAAEGEGPFPEKFLELFKIREQVKPAKEMGSIRGIITDLRALATTLKIDAENGNSRAAKELAIVEQERQKMQQRYTEENRAIVALRQENDIFTTLMNNRLEYYRQLQHLSDMVAPLEEDEKDRVRKNMEKEEEKLAGKIASSTAKRRYLIYLRDEANTDPQQQRLCVICQSTFELGALTICGHQFCKECMGLWWNAHRNCPVCKRKLTRHELHDITYKPQELRGAEEIVKGPSAGLSATSIAERSAIYSDISKSTLAQIKNIDLDGPSFTTKVDTLARHLIWLRDSDPGAKSIIFSQFKDFLDILGRALARFRIGFTTIDRPGGIEQFKEDPGIECFLLHAKAHSSGLNLVNANHVFLCEPLINTALELQAIARVHRIGQQQATTVWLYIIDGTVEDSIYQISVRRRLEHLDQYGKGKATELTAEMLDSSNSMELQHVPLAKLLTKGHSGGEVVDNNDLWSCLFGSGNKQVRAQSSARLDLEVRRHLGAEAAEQRSARNSSDI